MDIDFGQRLWINIVDRYCGLIFLIETLWIEIVDKDCK